MSYYGNFDGLMNMNVSYDWSSWGSSVPSVPPPVIPSAPAPSVPSAPSAPYVSSEPTPSQQAPSAPSAPSVSSAPVVPQGGTRVSIPTQIELPRYTPGELRQLDDKIFGKEEFKTAESLRANDLPSNSLSSDSSVSIFSSQGVKTIAIQNSTPLMAGGGLMAGLAFAAESKLLGMLAAGFFGLGVAGLVMLGQAVEEGESLP